ncbi:MAG: hypothetical protein NVS3B5_03310 [Sphingomicrobium sp.]
MLAKDENMSIFDVWAEVSAFKSPDGRECLNWIAQCLTKRVAGTLSDSSEYWRMMDKLLLPLLSVLTPSLTTISHRVSASLRFNLIHAKAGSVIAFPVKTPIDTVNTSVKMCA